MRYTWTDWEIGFLQENYPQKGLSYCADILKHRNKGSIQRKAGKLDLVKNRSHPKIILSYQETQTLYGCLLGDGSIEKEGRFIYRSAQFEHVKFVSDIFSKYATQKYINGPVRSDCFDARSQKIHSTYTFKTQNNILLKELYQKWYPEGIKIVPRDLELTSLTCLLWYIGDGNLNSGKHIILYTNGFTYNDVYFLTQKLNELGFESSIQNKKSRENKLPIIYIPRRTVKRFLEYIGPCPVQCYSYKWDNKEPIEEFSFFPSAKKILQLDIDGKLVKEWESASQAVRELGFNSSGHISSVCSGKRKTYKGFKWKFATELT
jgi:hypothetical protein